MLSFLAVSRKCLPVVVSLLLFLFPLGLSHNFGSIYNVNCNAKRKRFLNRFPHWYKVLQRNVGLLLQFLLCLLSYNFRFCPCIRFILQLCGHILHSSNCSNIIQTILSFWLVVAHSWFSQVALKYLFALWISVLALVPVP